jgi:hypothetical protein
LLDGKFAFSLEAEVVLKEKLQLGQELSAERIELLQKNSRYQRCLDTAQRYLDYRPRSEYEMNQRLTRRGFDAADIQAVYKQSEKAGFDRRRQLCQILERQQTILQTAQPEIDGSGTQAERRFQRDYRTGSKHYRRYRECLPGSSGPCPPFNSGGLPELSPSFRRISQAAGLRL